LSSVQTRFVETEISEIQNVLHTYDNIAFNIVQSTPVILNVVHREFHKSLIIRF